jgi:SAM-dependent methyltransferase
VILMAEHERWQVSTDAAEVYESCFVPAIFGAWAGPVADAAGISRSDKVLDVGCGTGVLAREALRRAGPDGQVVGLDLNEGSIRFPSVMEFIRIEVKGSPLADMLSDDAMQALAAESENALMEFVVPSGEIVMPMDAHIVTAGKG